MRTKLFILVLLLSFACGKKDNEPQPTPAKACQMTRVEDEDGYTLYEYDASGRFTKSTSYDKSNKAESTLLTEYSNGKLTQIRSFDGANTSGTPKLTVAATTDANGNVQTLSMPFLGTQATATFSYSGGRVSGIAVTAGGVQGSSYRFEYDNRGNISKTFEKESPAAVEKLITESTYDDKTNPGQGNVGLLAYAALYGFVSDIYSPNNTLTTKNYDSDGTISHTDTFTYTYNDKGFPVTVKQVTQAPRQLPESSNVTLQYACK